MKESKAEKYGKLHEIFSPMKSKLLMTFKGIIKLTIQKEVHKTILRVVFLDRRVAHACKM